MFLSHSVLGFLFSEILEIVHQDLSEKGYRRICFHIVGFDPFSIPLKLPFLPALSSDDLKLDIVGSCIINSRHSNPYPYTVNLPWNILSTDQRATCRVAQVGANLHLFPDTVWRSHPKISYCMEIKKRTEIEQKNICFCLPPDYFLISMWYLF